MDAGLKLTWATGLRAGGSAQPRKGEPRTNMFDLGPPLVSQIYPAHHNMLPSLDRSGQTQADKGAPM